MRSVEFHPEAQDEFISAAQFYERQADGLGLDFILTVQHTPARVSCLWRRRYAIVSDADLQDAVRG